MTIAVEVLGVHRAVVDTPCRSCGTTITRGRRIALVASVGGVCLHCLITPPGDPPEESTMPPSRQGVEDDGAQDPRAVDWWQW